MMIKLTDEMTREVFDAHVKRIAVALSLGNETLKNTAVRHEVANGVNSFKIMFNITNKDFAGMTDRKKVLR